MSKKSFGKKLLALVLAAGMCASLAAPAYAGGRFGNKNRGFSFGSLWDWLFGASRQEQSVPELNLLEDETTVANGDLLRADTYAVADPQAETDTVKYFPVSMFDYDQVKYNNVLRAQEFTTDLTAWNGLYMGNDNNKSYAYDTQTVTYANPHLEKVTAPIRNGQLNLEAGAEYVLVSGVNGDPSNHNSDMYVAVGINGSRVISVENHGNENIKQYVNNVAKWTISRRDDGTYRFLNGGNNLYVSSSSVNMNSNNGTRNLTVSAFSGDSSRIMIGNGSTYMNKAGGYNHNVGSNFGVWTDEKDAGSSFYLYKVVNEEKTVETPLTKSLEYADYNRWTAYMFGQVDDKWTEGNHIYQGLAQSTLDANGQIQFNHEDAGLFTETVFDGKTVYTNVGLPFEYDSSSQRYSFNAKEMGAWFEGTPASNVNLTYSKIPQAHTQGQDKTAAGWFPFDDSTNTNPSDVQGDSHKEAINAKKVPATPNHYFGMAASIDFTMTSDGKMKNGDDIDFHFSGDDDVWVFIDGKLVLDMGGIHNRINGDINFADGTWSIKQAWDVINEEELKDTLAEDVNNGTENTSGSLWETLGVDGITTFAATETHTLSVFYLERGAGASNCEISFNLPMKDYVSVTKDATKDSEGTQLTEKEQETVNNMDFTYTIYCNNKPYANQVYTVLNAITGNVIGTAYTNANGQFTIKNNQTARFTTEFAAEGETWYVKESDPGAAFVNDKTKWSSTSVTIDSEEKGRAEGLTSNKVTVVGSEEASGKLSFLCENILDAKLANPGVVTMDDRIVIDYGLPVQIDVKNNDLFRADTYEIVGLNGTVSADGTSFTDGANANGVYSTAFGNVRITDAANGKLEYQLTKQLTDVEEITYIVKVSSTVLTHPDVPGSEETHTETVYATAKVYVIPATSMYYEENFKNADGTNMITYSDGWTAVGTSDDEYQEPGVVKTKTDSPYGSDVAYLNDRGDSNGTSMYADADAGTKGYRQFKYTFTGTGTSFFGRTTNESGYILVRVKDSSGKQVDSLYINTRFLNDNDKTLYNIPIYTLTDLEYDTYTVSVALYYNVDVNNPRYGHEFWLDGIRVQNPMNQVSAKYNIAETAYSDDGEAHVNIVTLRDKIIDAAADTDEDGNFVWEDGFAVLTDINGNIVSLTDYISIGPKQEVYLAGDANNATNGQKVSFTLLNWDMDHKLYLGLKAPMGTATVKINGKELTVSNTADCYYNLTDGGFITVDADGNAKIEIQAVSGVVSITNIKTTGAVRFEIIPGEDVEG